MDPAISTRILQQLGARNALETAFSGVFSDYQRLLQHSRELQVRCKPDNGYLSSPKEYSLL